MGTVASKERADRRVIVPLRLFFTAILAGISIFSTIPLFLGNFFLLAADFVTYLCRLCAGSSSPQSVPEGTNSFFFFSTYFCRVVFTIVAWIEFKAAILSGFDELTLIPTRDVLYPPHSAGDNEKRLA